MDGKKIIITEASIRRDLQLDDEEGVDCLPNSTIFEQLALMRKPTRNVTRVPQPSDLIEHVVDEAVHKDLGDSLVRATTTSSSLEAEQDSGNINKTQSKATLNEPCSQETDSGVGPRCQEAIGDTTAQTRFDSVSKHSDDSLLTRGNTFRSNEDRLELNELMALCTTLQTRVLDLEKKKTTQRNKIDSLKRKERRIDAIDQDEDITLVNVQDDAEMFDVNDLGGEEVFVTKQEVVKDVNENVVKEVVNDAQDSTATTTITTEELTLAQALEALKTSEPKTFEKFYKLDYGLLEKLQDYWGKVNEHEFSPFANWRNYIRGPYANYYDNFLDMMEHEDKERSEVSDDHERPVCNIRRFEMVKYSFRDDEDGYWLIPLGCESCRGAHYTKNSPLKEEGKTLDEAYYTQFGVPFPQGGRYRATAMGFYQRDSENPSYQERRKTMEESLSKFLAEFAKRHDENSNLIKEI
nr:hypothetical protein [Tanacetum cinerariifolium]